MQNTNPAKTVLTVKIHYSLTLIGMRHPLVLLGSDFCQLNFFQQDSKASSPRSLEKAPLKKTPNVQKVSIPMKLNFLNAKKLSKFAL